MTHFNFLYPTYLSQINSYLHETFRKKTSCWCPFMIKPLQSRIPPLPFPSPSPSRQSNLLILIISAKSSRIFTKFSGKIPLGVLRWLKQKTNKSINKQTNKQTNKHFFKSYISQPNQVGSSWDFQGIFLWVFQDD